MTALNPVILVLLFLAGLVAGVVLLVTLARLGRARARAKRRVVEKPNSHYTSRLARDTEVRHRWREIDLEKVHEINRVEVIRLIDKVEATSVDALRPAERAFLDHMAEIAPPRPEPKPREMSRPLTDLRERPT